MANNFQFCYFTNISRADVLRKNRFSLQIHRNSIDEIINMKLNTNKDDL